jgi:hypothetical protein
MKKVPNIDGERIMRFGHLVSRYGLVVVLAWIGAGKYVQGPGIVGFCLV